MFSRRGIVGEAAKASLPAHQIWGSQLAWMQWERRANKSQCPAACAVAIPRLSLVATIFTSAASVLVTS